MKKRLNFLSLYDRILFLRMLAAAAAVTFALIMVMRADRFRIICDLSCCIAFQHRFRAAANAADDRDTLRYQRPVRTLAHTAAQTYGYAVFL